MSGGHDPEPQGSGESGLILYFVNASKKYLKLFLFFCTFQASHFQTRKQNSERVLRRHHVPGGKRLVL